MYGLEAISFHNGWIMALAGALIVFAGLVVLSLAISQIHKVLIFLEKPDFPFAEKRKPPKPDAPPEKPDLPFPQPFPSDLNELADLYKPLLEEIGESFLLAELYELARKNNYPHPHITITAFRESGILISQGEGFFTWKQPEDHEDNATD